MEYQLADLEKFLKELEEVKGIAGLQQFSEEYKSEMQTLLNERICEKMNIFSEIPNEPSQIDFEGAKSIL